jgi:antitoxin ParD1/3/4
MRLRIFAWLFESNRSPFQTSESEGENTGNYFNSKHAFKKEIMPTRNINLTEHFDRFVERQVSSGRYSNASEIVHDALRLLEEQEREAKWKAIRQAAKQGFDEIDQSKGIVLKGKKAISRFIAEIESEVRTQIAKNGAYCDLPRSSQPVRMTARVGLPRLPDTIPEDTAE